MRLVAMNSHVDWKYRTSHGIKTIAKGSQKELERKMTIEIREFFIEQLTEDMETSEKNYSEKSIINAQNKWEMMPLKELKKVWESEGRWEMNNPIESDSDKQVVSRRLFCGGSEGDSWGVSWSIIGD